ncbi:MAG: hypothetical protein ACRDAX_06320 [Propionibacteriaceae bacterium]
MTNVKWLAGTVLLAIGCGLHVFALTLGPLTVIQPVGILAVPFSILLANRLNERTSERIIWILVAITTAGIVGFTVLASHTAVDHVEPSGSTVQLAAAIVWIGSLVCFAVANRGPRWLHSLAWAWGGAFLYGLGSAHIKLLTMMWGQWHHPLFWTSAIGLALAYGVGAWTIQQSYATGPAEVVVGVMTTVDPIIAVVFGLVVLDEGRAVTLPVAIAMILTAAIAAAGVFFLSKYHPDAQKHRTFENTMVLKKEG